MKVLNNDELKIEFIEQSDIPSIVKLLKENGMNYGSVELYSEYFIKVCLGEKIIGCVAIIPRKGFSEVKSLIVEEKYRSFKIFNKMCNIITYIGKEHNNPCVVLKVDKNNPAILLYRRKGFEPMIKEEYEEIYGQLRNDCITCHTIVKTICNPTYFIFDLRKKIPDHPAFINSDKKSLKEVGTII